MTKPFDHHTICRCCKRQRANAIYRVTKTDDSEFLIWLCAECGFGTYRERSRRFGKETIKSVKIVKHIETDYRPPEPSPFQYYPKLGMDAHELADALMKGTLKGRLPK